MRCHNDHRVFSDPSPPCRRARPCRGCHSDRACSRPATGRPATDRRRRQTERLRRLHGAGTEGLERARHRSRDRREGQARIRQGVRLPRLRKQDPVHPDDDAADRVQLEALHGRRFRIARRRGQAALGRADQAVRSRHPVLQRRARPLGHDPRHVVASYGHHPARQHLVQVHVHATGALGSPALPRTSRPDSHDLPLQQLDVYGRRPGHRGGERADVGAVRQAPDLRSARNVAFHPHDRGQHQGTGTGRAVLRAPRQHRTLPAAVLHGGSRHCAGRRD